MTETQAQDRKRLGDVEFLREIAAIAADIPAMFGIEQEDVHRLREIAKAIELTEAEANAMLDPKHGGLMRGGALKPLPADVVSNGPGDAAFKAAMDRQFVDAMRTGVGAAKVDGSGKAKPLKVEDMLRAWDHEWGQELPPKGKSK